MSVKLPNMPGNIAALELDARGYPTPWFVFRPADGSEPDFRIADAGKRLLAAKHRICWVCGKPLRRMAVFTVGPMCAINRISSDPPSHPECAIFAAKVCPFLVHPRRARRTDDMPAEAGTDGVMIARNPGVSLLWGCTKWRIEYDGAGGFLFGLGPPQRLQWWARGREATRAEVLESIRTGLPILEAEAKRDGADALSALALQTTEAMALVPKPGGRRTRRPMAAA